jgi:hypothetical protein
MFLVSILAETNRAPFLRRDQLNIMGGFYNLLPKSINQVTTNPQSHQKNILRDKYTGAATTNES